MTPTLDDLLMTFEEAYSKANFSTHSNNCREALAAVIKTHIVPMVASAFNEGNESALAWVKNGFPEETDTDYAARIEREIMGAGE